MDNLFYLPSLREELRQVNLQLPSGAGVPIGIKYSVSNLKFALKPDPGFAPAFKNERKKKFDLEYGKEITKDIKD